MMNMIKVLLAVCFVTAGISLAQAQTPGTRQDVAQMRAPVVTATQVGKRQNDNSEANYPSGFNSGPTKLNVKGCVGPTSYCNIYFGS
jgi:hypothetical protein